jgi:phospholipase C
MTGRAAAGVVATGSLLGQTRYAGAAVPRAAALGSVLDHPASECPVDTVVVLMMENRSFDHFLGWLGSDSAYVDAGKRRYGKDFSVAGRTNLRYPNAHGELVPTESISNLGHDAFRGCGHKIPSHGWTASRVQRDHGFLANGSGNDVFAVSYNSASDLPVLGTLAKRFTLFDHYHSSLLGPTFPNRQYMHSAQSEGMKGNPGPLDVGVYKAETIWDRLDRAGVSARYYYYDLPLLLLWGDRFANRVSSVDRFLTDAKAGTLPNVAFVDPGFTDDDRTDDHPQGDTRSGQRYVAALFNALARSPQWARTAFVVTYDEWGGFFDHVRPPILADDRASTNDANNFGQAGFRVPTVLASPYAKPGFVDHRVYDHTSILRFLEWRFLGAPPEGPGGSGWWLTKRDQNANNLGASLQDGSPRLDSEARATIRIKSLAAPSGVCPNNTEHATIRQPPNPFVQSKKFADLTRTTYRPPTHQPWFRDLPA